jgi:hypothetical protein
MNTILAADLGQDGCFLVLRNIGNGPEVCHVRPWRGWTLRAERRQTEIGAQLRFLCQRWGVKVIAAEKALHLKANPRIGSSQRWRTKVLQAVIAHAPECKGVRLLETDPQGPTEAYYSWKQLRETCVQEMWFDREWDRTNAGQPGEHVADAAAIALWAESELRTKARMAKEA